MTGGWFANNCQGEFEASAAAAAKPRAFFFGGSGFNGRNACALTTAAQVNNISTTTVLTRIILFMIPFFPYLPLNNFAMRIRKARTQRRTIPSPTQIRLVTQLLKNVVSCQGENRQTIDQDNFCSDDPELHSQAVTLNQFLEHRQYA
jgi:hypothetical protein